MCLQRTLSAQRTAIIHTLAHTHDHIHTHEHNPITHTLSPLFPASKTVFYSLNCCCPLFSNSLIFDSFSLYRPTSPMTLFYSIPAPSFLPVFMSCCPFIHPHPPNSNPILSLVSTFPVSSAPSLLPPPLPSSSSYSWPKTDA